MSASPTNSRAVLTLALLDLRRAWRGLLAIDLACKALAGFLVVPLITVGARALIATSGEGAVADQAILSFLLSPTGLVTLLVAGTAQIGLFALELTALLAGASQAALGRRVVPREAIGFAIRRTSSVLSLAGRIWIRTLLIAAPFLGACGLIYMTMLTKFDINYYLKERPSIFLLAVGLAATLLLVMAWLLVPRFISWSFALPIVLFERVGPRQAMALSHERVQVDRRTVRRTLTAWALFGAIFSMAAHGAVTTLARWAAPSVAERLGLLLSVLVVVLFLWAAAYLLANVAVMAGLGTVGTRLYQQLSGGSAATLTWKEEATQAATPAWRLSRGTLSFLLAGSLLFAVAFGGWLLSGIHRDTRVDIIAHRGASGVAPENTMAAFQAALNQSTDWVELDVQELADGTVVVMHDSDLMRLARNNLKIWDATKEDLAGIDIGTWFAPRFAAERVPTLESVLLLCKNRAKVVIELKYYGHDQQLEERVAEIVERTGMQDQIHVMSLRYEMVSKMKSLRPDWTVGLLTATAIGNLASVNADFLAVSTGMAKPSLVRAAHASSKKLFVWTVNDPMSMALLVNRGVDALITDEPGVARGVLQRMEQVTTGQRLLLGLASWFGIKPRETDTARDATQS